MNSIGGDMPQGRVLEAGWCRRSARPSWSIGVQVRATTSTSHGVVTGDFNSAYTVKVNSKREGAERSGCRADGNSNMTIEAKWLSAWPCRSSAGDMIRPGRPQVNIRRHAET